MPNAARAVSLGHDTPQLAAAYDEHGIVQFKHGRTLIDQLRIGRGEKVLDVGAGTGRLAEYVAGLVGPDGEVVGIDPLVERIAIARSRAGGVLRFEVGQAEDLSWLGAAHFDVVYLNSVFHWIADKARVLEEIFRVLKPGGRLGLNTQDPAQPHQSRVLIQRALSAAGLDGRRAGSHPALGVGQEELAVLFRNAGFTGYADALHTIEDTHSSVDELLAWSASSSFGNFLIAFSESERGRVRDALAGLIEQRRAPDGIKLERYLRFATASRP
jgi:SAM-dependent methyltransferase